MAGGSGMTQIELPQGTIDVRDTGGDGPTLLFVHGILVTGRLWDPTIAALGDGFRCVVPYLPLGAHSRPMNATADLSPVGVARLLADLIVEMDLRDVTVVGNDTGGAICQLLITRHPERIERLVLTNCDAYENFLPLAFRPLQWLGKVPGLAWVMAQGFRIPLAQTAFVKTVARTPIDPDLRRSFARSFASNPEVRRDAKKVLAGIDKNETIEAAKQFPHFHHPVLIVWGTDDRFFKPKYAEQLAGDFPDSRLEWIEGSRAFVHVDKPQELAAAIDKFVSSTASSA